MNPDPIRVLIVDDHVPFRADRRHLARLRPRIGRVDTGADREGGGVFEKHHSTRSDGPPVVYVDAPQFPTHTILFDLENAGFLATDHLIKHGHEQIGMITAPRGFRHCQ